MHNADSPRYRYNSLDGKLQRHKSGQEIDSSFKFFHLGCLGFQDKICDGFRLCRGFDSFPQTDGYAELDKSQSEVHQEIVIVNLNEDKNLVRFLLEVVDSIQNIFDVLQKVKILAEMTADRLGGPAVVGQVAELYWSQDVKQKESLKIQLGDLNIGQHIHRAIMFKFLADNLSVPVRLQWGEEGDQAYLWEGENEYEVDLMQNPGNITKVEYFSQKSGSDCNVHRESECKSKSLPIDMNLPNLDKVSESNHSDRHSKPKSSRTVGPFKFLNKFGINQVKSNRVQSCPMFDITRAESDKDSDFVVVDKEDIPIPRNSYSSNNENEGQIIREWIQQQSCSDCAGPITVSNIAEKTRSLQKQQHDASFKYVLRQEDNNSDTFQVCENCSQNQTTEFEFDIKTTAIEQDKSLTTQPVTSPRCCSPFSIHGPRLDPSPHLQDQSTTVSPEDSEAQFEPTDPFSSPEASPELAFEKKKEGCIDWGGAHTETNDAVNREVQQSVVEGNDIDMHAKQDIVFDLSLADIRPRGNSEEIPATPGSVLSGKSSLECGPTHAQVTELSKWLVQYEELENLQPLDKGSYGQVYLGFANMLIQRNVRNPGIHGSGSVARLREERKSRHFFVRGDTLRTRHASTSLARRIGRQRLGLGRHAEQKDTNPGKCGSTNRAADRTLLDGRSVITTGFRRNYQNSRSRQERLSCGLKFESVVKSSSGIISGCLKQKMILLFCFSLGFDG
eukprot:TRINITY_DN2023_c0_g3_i1.p1 TRINITY_DN2023_c0_g3~~TRINITY_DN2023_c0_g3_i1.p1  ORF type:complete len:729 (-),score=72.40 TRINITY_DN2023_c0_g3_i1:967-3153(-)